MKMSEDIERTFLLSTPELTAYVGRVLSGCAVAGDVFALVGDLGAGKSTLARAFIQDRTASDDIPSPTFTLVQTYDQGVPALWHVDAYRLSDVLEVQELGLEDAFEDAISLIEWPDRLAEILPQDGTIWLKLTHHVTTDGQDAGRVLKVHIPARAAKRFRAALRGIQRQLFLASVLTEPFTVQPIAGDASSRCYFRVSRSELGSQSQSYILMDAEHMPHVIAPFMNASAYLLSLGLSAPHTRAVDAAQALLLSEDLGPHSFRQVAADDPEHAYGTALMALAILQQNPAPVNWTAEVGPRTMAARVPEELDRFLTWYVPHVRAGRSVEEAERTAFQDLWQHILAASLAGPQVFSVLDCIHDNLFWLPDRSGAARLGFIDVQDAVLAPAVYDLMSLLWDVRHPVPTDQRSRLLTEFAELCELSTADVARDAALWSVQRNLKILGTFVRLAIQEDKPAYLQFMPVVKHMITEQLDQPVLAPVTAWLDAHDVTI